MVKFFFNRLNLSNKVQFQFLENFSFVQSANADFTFCLIAWRDWFSGKLMTHLIFMIHDDSSSYQKYYRFQFCEIFNFSQFLKTSLRNLIFRHFGTDPRKANWTQNKRKKLVLESWNSRSCMVHLLAMYCSCTCYPGKTWGKQYFLEFLSP